jgi:hypothetical protein
MPFEVSGVSGYRSCIACSRLPAGVFAICYAGKEVFILSLQRHVSRLQNLSPNSVTDTGG